MDELKQIGRLALRHEGQNWNAYYALNETMDGALFLGSIRMGIVTQNKTLKQAFMDLMREAVSDILEERIGVRPEWKEPHDAPEHEKAGHS